MPRRRTYAAFLSFASPDRRIVQALRDLFGVVDAKVYFALEELPRAGTPEWMEAIRSGISESSSFVPIITRNSLTRSWVIYETGAADALSLPRCPARVAGISIDEMRFIPGGEKFVFNLYDKFSAIELIIGVLKKHGALQRGEGVYRKALVASEELKRLVSLAQERWVFIAGSLPTGENARRYPSSLQVEGVTLGPAEVLARVARDVTRGLLTAGFSVVSCANVEYVGKEVMTAAHQWMAGQAGKIERRYKIGGLYPIDRLAREEQTEEQRLFLRGTLRNFRKSYLSGNEWLLLLGGNQGTWEEYEAVMDIDNIRLAALPGLGGTAKRLLTEQVKNCLYLPNHGNTWGEEALRELVAQLANVEPGSSA